ncbi:MAG: hydroxymethylglutaryl-CoA lyase [Chlorobi bacterium]|nr:hydroxymethylglutaryl-CoA lyase [Chlorobiota bacterium]
MIKITESPRDAMQALKAFIPTDKKIDYINELFKVGFDTIDVGSFVSSRAVPQMSDTAEVLKNIKDKYSTKISVLVGNERYAEIASQHDNVDYLNYPFSISNTFQKKNMNANLDKSIRVVDKILNVCEKNNKTPIITIAVAFGNPYDEDWGIDILMDWIEVLYDMGLRYLPLADTTASGTSHLIGLVFDNVIREFEDVEFNFHLHTKAEDTIAKIEAAYNSGCRNFDTVFNGMGGCPMSGKELVANLNTVTFINWLDKNNIEHKIKKSFFNNAIEKASEIF